MKRSKAQIYRTLAWIVTIFVGGIANGATNCLLTPVCTVNGVNVDMKWAQHAIGADLMLNEVRKLGVGPEAVKVAIVDSDLDKRVLAHNLLSGTIGFVKGYDGAGELDEINRALSHGTAVTGLFSGVDSLGIAPNAKVTFYRSTAPGFRFDDSVNAVQRSILKACEDGNEVINLSVGSFSDQTGSAQSQSDYKNLLDQLANKGCVVLHSAGNDGVLNLRSDTEELDSPMIDVEALSEYGQRTSFTSQGQLAAPGEKIFLVQTPEIMHGIQCDGVPGVAMNGTSFASPITAAVYAETIAVLKTKPFYLRLSSRDRIRLVNRIVRASKTNNSINGLKAVLIADWWNSQANGLIPDVEQLKSGLATKTSGLCAQPQAKCQRLACGQIQSCVDQDRFTAIVCDGTKSSVFSDLAQTYYRSGNFNVADWWMSQIDSADHEATAGLGGLALYNWKLTVDKLTTDFATYQKGIKNPIDKNVPMEQNLYFKGRSFQIYFHMLPNLIGKFPQSAKFQATAAFISAFEHFALGERILDTENLHNADLAQFKVQQGSPEDDLNGALKLIKEYAKNYGQQAMLDSLGMAIDNRSGVLYPSQLVNRAAIYKIIGILLQDSFYSEFSPQLSLLREKIYRVITTNTVQMIKDPSSQDIFYAVQDPFLYLFEIVNDHREDYNRRISLAIANNDPSQLSIVDLYSGIYWQSPKISPLLTSVDQEKLRVLIHKGPPQALWGNTYLP